MIKEFEHFHPDIVHIFRSILSYPLNSQKMLISARRVSEEVKCWPLYVHDPIPQSTYGKVILIGDAAHPVSD